MRATAIVAVAAAAAALLSPWGILATRAAGSLVGDADGVGPEGVEVVAGGDCVLLVGDEVEGAVVVGDGDPESEVTDDSFARLSAG